MSTYLSAYCNSVTDPNSKSFIGSIQNTACVEGKSRSTLKPSTIVSTVSSLIMIKLSYIVIDRVERFPSTDEFRRALAFLKECGYEGVELNMTLPLLDKLDVLEQWLNESGLVMPSFMTGEAYFEGLCLSSPESSTRLASVDRLRRCVDAAKRLGSIFVVGMLQGTFRDEPNALLARQRIAEGLRAVADYAEEQDVEFVIEPVNHLQVSFHNSVTEVRALIDGIGSDAIRPMVDTIHMNIEEASAIEAISACGHQLAHVHLCESNGGKFGSGHIDFHSILSVLGKIDYKRFGSVKVYRHLEFQEAARSSFEYLRKIQSVA
jgi:sugar phosphate isomerase/epimerase